MTIGALDGRLRVVTFNIRTALAFEPDPRRCWLRRRRAVWAVLADLAPDVIALQEAHGLQLRDLLRGAGGYSATATRPRGRGTGERCPVLVRSDRFSVTSERVRWFTDDGLRGDGTGVRMSGARHPRIVAEVRLVDHRSGQELTVLNTHLATEREPRAVALAQLGAAVAPTSCTVVLGDFNCRLGAPEMAPVHQAGMAAAPVTGATFHRFEGMAEGDPIDHILVTGGLRVVGAFVDRNRPDGVLASDHWPVVADIRPAKPA